MLMRRVILCALATLTMANAACAGATGSAQASSTGPNRISVDIGDGTDDNDGPERIAARQDPAKAAHRLVATNGWTELMVKDGALFLQATDVGLKKLGEPQREKNSNLSLFEEMIHSVASSAVKSLLNRSIGLRLAETKSALVRNGEFVVVTCSGKEVFNKVTINDTVQKYPQDEAERFVKSFMQIRSKLPACSV